MDRNLLVTRTSTILNVTDYESLTEYIKNLRPTGEMKSPTHSPLLHAMFTDNIRSKINFKNLVNTQRFVNSADENQWSDRHSRDFIQITSKELSRSMISISNKKIAAKATNNAYCILARVALTPQRISHIEGLPDRACPICFVETGRAETNNQFHIYNDCVTSRFMKKFLRLTWYNHEDIFINVSTESYYLLLPNMQVDKTMNGKQKSKLNKYVHMSFICSHFIVRNLINNVKITSSWTALKRMITHHFRILIDKSIHNKFPPEFFQDERISRIPRFKEGPPWKKFPIQMTNRIFQTLQEDQARVNKQYTLLRNLGLTDEYDKLRTCPDQIRMTRIQKSYNQGLALIASEIGATSAQIQTMKADFHVFWSEWDY